MKLTMGDSAGVSKLGRPWCCRNRSVAEEMTNRLWIRKLRRSKRSSISFSRILKCPALPGGNDFMLKEVIGARIRGLACRSSKRCGR